jgi:WD40 repeat protein
MPARHFPAVSPFKLLQPYGKADAACYFGREKETRLLAETLKRSKFLLLYGASGTGKTSLIQCGLQGMYSSRDWMPVFIRRGTNLPDALRQQLLEQYRTRYQLRPPGLASNLPEMLSPDLPLRNMVKYLFRLTHVPVYLIFDQFEEIFTLGDAAEQRTFFDELAAFRLFEEDLFCKWLLVVREEYIAHFYAYEQELPFLFEARFRVEKMRREQLLRVVEGTLGYRYEGYPTFETGPGAATQILNNLTDARGETDLTDLQVLLDRLYREAVEKNAGRNDVLVFDKALAGEHRLENVLSDFLTQQITAADRIMAQSGARPLALVILFKLVTPDGTKQNSTAPKIQAALNMGKTAVDAPTLDQYLTLMASSEMRLLNRIRFANSPDEHFEIWHDRLAAQVFRLFSADEVNQREAQTTLTAKKKRFDQLTADKKAQRGEYLSQEELNLIGHSLNIALLPPDQKAFYGASAAHHRTQRQREKTITAIAIAAAIIFALMAAATYYALQRSETARLYNEGLVEAATNPTTGLQKILAAIQRDPEDPEKRRGAYEVYANNLLYEPLLTERAGPLNTAACSPDGQLVATAVRNVIYLYRTGETTPLDSAFADNAVNCLVFKGRDTLIAGSEDRKVYLWAGLHTASKLRNPKVLDVGERVQRLATDQQGIWLATAHNENTAQRWNLVTRSLHQKIATEHKVGTTTLSPDGLWWVSGTDFGEVLAMPEQGRTAALWASKTNVPVCDLAFSTDGSTLAAAFGDGALWLWQRDSALSKPFIFADSIQIGTATLNSLTFSDDGLLLLVAAANGIGYVVDCSTRRPLFTFQADARALLEAQFGGNQDFIFTTADNGVLRRWPFPRPFPDYLVPISTSPAEQVCFTSDGQRLLVRSADAIVQVLDGTTLQKTTPYAGHQATVTALAAGATLAASGDEQGGVHVWQPLTAASLGRVQCGEAPIKHIALDDTGTNVLAAGEDNTDVWWWRPSDTAPITIGPANQSVAALALAPDGSSVIVAGFDSTMIQYDSKGMKKFEVRLPWVPFSLHYTPQNKGFTALGPDGQALQYLFSATVPTVVRLPGMYNMAWAKNAVVYATFSPQNGTDLRCTIEVCTADGLKIQSLRHRTCDLTSLSISPDGGLVAASGSDGKVLLWRVRKKAILD